MFPGVNVSRNPLNEKKSILADLHAAVKKCQAKYGGRTELATESDPIIVQLCNGFEAALCHGLRQPSTSAFKQVADLVSGVDPPSFWNFVSCQLTAHERERYATLRQVWTDRGRTKSLIRAALNERSLERYLHCWLAHHSLTQCYEEWALMRDTEGNSMLPSMAAGLVSILFAISIDLPELNINRPGASIPRSEPIIAVRPPQAPTIKKNVKRQVILFDDDSNRHHSDTVSSGAVVKVTALIENNVADEDKNAKILVMSEKILTNRDNNISCLPSTTDIPIQENSINCQSFDSPESESINEVFSITEDTLDIRSPFSDSGVVDSQHIRTDSLGSDLSSLRGSVASEDSCISSSDITVLKTKLAEKEEQCSWLEARVAELSLENTRLRESARSTTTVTGPYFTIDIPRVHKIGSHYEYQVTIKACRGLECWSILRRYKNFYKLHRDMCKKHVQVGGLDFPPKKTIGNMDSVFVEERRQRLQAYLRQMVLLLPQLASCNTRSQLERTLAFFRAEK